MTTSTTGLTIANVKSGDAFHIQPGDEVFRYQCVCDHNHTQFKRGEAFLVGPGHYPYNGYANYFCKAHLLPEIQVWEPTFRQPTAVAADL